MHRSVNLEYVLRAQKSGQRSYAAEPESKTRKEIFRRRKLSDREKADFCVQLSVMLQSRVSLHRALETLRKQADKPRMRKVIEKLESEIKKGNSFAKALSLLPGVFEDLFVVTAEVGQESGRLADVLTHLASHLEKMNGLRRKFTQALTYPALVLLVATLAVSFLLLYVVPTFAEMFKSFQMELPDSTKLVLLAGELFRSYGPYFLLSVLCIVVMFWKSLQSRAVREGVQTTSLRLPLIGDILLKNHVARFCRTLGTLLQAQVSLVDALTVSGRMMASPEMRKDVAEILRQVKLGKSVAEPVVKSRFFPPVVSQMIAVGEETNELDQMLIRVAGYYEKELDAKVEALASVIEPILIMILGAIVASVLIAMYMPMFDLVNSVGGAQ